MYGGQRDESVLASALVCAQAAEPPKVRQSKIAGKSDRLSMRLDAMDNDGVRLILSRELVNAETELSKARLRHEGDPLEMKQKIHRLENDVAALQAELSRAQKK